jgi:presenilin-like A22 family membrane protease
MGMIMKLAIPTLLSAAGVSYLAGNTLAAAGVGAIIGLIIGVGILAFPNLDRGGPEDSDDFFH